MTHPMQPLEIVDGVIRFRRNAIVCALLDTGKLDMNALAVLPFSDEDREHFAQLIGYSVSGYGELSYVSEASYTEASAKAAALLAEQQT